MDCLRGLGYHDQARWWFSRQPFVFAGSERPKDRRRLAESAPENAMVGEGFAGLEGRFGTILMDPPWRFANRTGKMAPEHKRLRRYQTMSFEEIAALPVGDFALAKSHLYLWCPNALLSEGLQIMKRWGFTYKTNLVWYKTRKDGGPDGRGVGFYFRNVTELLLFGTRGQAANLEAGVRAARSTSC